MYTNTMKYHKQMFRFLLYNRQIMPVIVGNQIFVFIFLHYSSELLEIMFHGRAFHSLAVNGKTIIFVNVLDECLI